MFLLVSLGAILGMLETAQAGTSLTYDWVTPNFGNGVHFSGIITVDSTGISSTPISLLDSMIQSWQISVFDHTNTLLFSLSSPTDSLKISTDSAIGSAEFFAPQITTTSIFLPALSGISAEEDYQTEFSLSAPVGQPVINWSGRIFSSVQPLESVVPQIFSSFTAVSITASFQFVADFSTSPNAEIEIAHVTPEPASLVIWSLVAGVSGVWQIRKRRRSSVAAA
jgi:hypothetical protein